MLSSVVGARSPVQFVFRRYVLVHTALKWLETSTVVCDLCVHGFLGNVRSKGFTSGRVLLLNCCISDREMLFSSEIWHWRISEGLGFRADDSGMGTSECECSKEYVFVCGDSAIVETMAQILCGIPCRGTTQGWRETTTAEENEKKRTVWNIR